MHLEKKHLVAFRKSMKNYRSLLSKSENEHATTSYFFKLVSLIPPSNSEKVLKIDSSAQELMILLEQSMQVFFNPLMLSFPTREPHVSLLKENGEDQVPNHICSDHFSLEVSSKDQY
ncbi:hypothetical protein CEXT_26141 [Caerostris extrusa]|uniref:Uncharacterized protein n=1 Tax=Caerostris extrusa TaxID=172846 RepID=A0AAV4YA30_CAEEX|nr:hypothetical protein CEXT_26141 [Caerostris extrusa]